ncbi:hypothetical protein EXIGLDRAFT_699275 [Exidia glandulosa HHB12029]|uniref:Protein YTP1-like C-terminal domain-containing protein n=1 Tax=Exidia glandulosa HHB12029 TaxID=1314781 RepID=A0A165MGL2_EXIGL|nr:hypothetical protein EXIGLDRAFT_699275 [Exidia glandulosa HHB12029]
MTTTPTALRMLPRTVVVLSLLALSHAHDHHEVSEADRNAPVDNVLWLHIALQTTLWGLLWPLGMVLGITRSRWHVPLQATNFALTAAGYVLGHKHGGRKFLPSAHEKMANFLLLPLAAMLVLGVYLKLHIHERTLRPYAVVAHGIIGKTWPLLAWIQMLFGAIALGDYCGPEALSQCLAHYIMGSAFVGYGVLLLLALALGGWAAWIEEKGISQEWIDSWVIMLWGIVNTFALHRGGRWSHKDMQHVSLGVLWWAGGALGILLSSKGRRSIVPALLIVITGWAMSAHEQAQMISTRVHGMFGIALMGAGVARIVEISFIDGRPAATSGWAEAWRMLTPFGLIAGGILFMSATDEELAFVSSKGVEMDHETYILLMFSLAFLVYTLTAALARAYLTTGRNANPHVKITSPEEAEYIQLAPTGGPVAASYRDGDVEREQFAIADEDDEDDDKDGHPGSPRL